MYIKEIFSQKCTNDGEFASWFPKSIHLGKTKSTEDELLLIYHATNEDLLTWTLGVQRYQCGY